MNSKKKICVFTSSRADYGILKSLMLEIEKKKDAELQILVSGAHLDSTQGNTYQEIEKDGFSIQEKVEMNILGSDRKDIAVAMGICLAGVASALNRLQPDILVVLGDRYELLPACSAALVMKIPIAHISGGDVTEGAIDNQVRHAVTKMAALHFPGEETSARRVHRLGEDTKTIFCYGELGLDRLSNVRISKAEISKSLNIPLERDWIICTYHPETLSDSRLDIERVKNLLATLSEVAPEFHTIVTAANSDHGGKEINQVIENLCRENPRRSFFSSVGDENFVGLLKHSQLMIGNSSSGIIEAASFRMPVINVGSRQMGRLMPENVIASDGSINDLKQALRRALSNQFRESIACMQNPYGSGDVAVKIADVLLSFEPTLYKGEFLT